MSNYIDTRNILLELYNSSNNYTHIEKNIIYKTYLTKLRKLAYKNLAIAQYDLAQHYDSMGFFGDPNPFYDEKKMFYWYNKSVNNGYIFAFNNLADLYERGVGCSKNLNKALELYEAGMKRGDVLAKNNFKILKKELKNEK